MSQTPQTGTTTIQFKRRLPGSEAGKTGELTPLLPGEPFYDIDSKSLYVGNINDDNPTRTTENKKHLTQITENAEDANDTVSFYIGENENNTYSKKINNVEVSKIAQSLKTFETELTDDGFVLKTGETQSATIPLIKNNTDDNVGLAKIKKDQTVGGDETVDVPVNVDKDGDLIVTIPKTDGAKTAEKLTEAKPFTLIGAVTGTTHSDLSNGLTIETEHYKPLEKSLDAVYSATKYGICVYDINNDTYTTSGAKFDEYGHCTGTTGGIRVPWVPSSGNKNLITNFPYSLLKFTDSPTFTNLTATNLTATGEIRAKKFIATSDKRLKENFRCYDSSSQEMNITDLPVYLFDYKDSDIKNQLGCFAQDLMKVCPNIVDKNSDGYLQIQESKIVYLLLEEVKKLKQELSNLKQTIDKL